MEPVTPGARGDRPIAAAGDRGVRVAGFPVRGRPGVREEPYDVAVPRPPGRTPEADETAVAGFAHTAGAFPLTPRGDGTGRVPVRAA